MRCPAHTTPSADFCPAVRMPHGTLSCRSDTEQISWGKLSRLPCTIYSKRPFGGPKDVLRYLARYTHRVAISNSRLIALDDNSVTFKWKDYRLEGPECHKVMTLATHEFIRRFLIHVLPAGC